MDTTLIFIILSNYIIVLKISSFIQEHIPDLHTVFRHISHLYANFRLAFK